MEEQKINTKPNIRDKKKNARLYPIYKMFSWDLIFYYAISFIFLIQTKKLSIAEIMFSDAMYSIFRIALQIPALTMIDRLGKRKSIIIGNLFLAMFLLCIMASTNVLHVIFAYIIMAFAFSIKEVAEPNLLYDSVTQRKGKGMFAKIDELGSRNYYYLDGITSMFTGVLFVVNGYLPIIVSLMFVVVSIALSTCFKEIYKINKEKNKTLKTRITEYGEELSTTFKFIIQSKRLQAIMLFVLFFEGIIYISFTLREGLLTEMNVADEWFAVIIATLTIVSGLFVSLQNIIHTKLKNRALAFMSIVYTVTFIAIGLICSLINNWWIVLILNLAIFGVQYAIQGPYETLLAKYLKSFATPKMRTKIDSTFGVIRSVSQFTIAMFASYLLTKTTPTGSFLILGFSFLVILVFILQWMKPRFGLKAEEYDEKDIKFKQVAK